MTRKGDWIQTYTGKRFWPMDPRPEDVDIIDIAHALANTCRFGGHSKIFYSVAEHSVHVSNQLPNRGLALVGLLHDASEAYIVDVPRPIKPYLDGYREIERSILDMILERYGHTGPIMWSTIKAVDNAMLATEAEQVMAEPPAEWFLPEPPLDLVIECWPPEHAKRAFLDRFDAIMQMQ